ncbi:MAG TPA: hypothetical protein VK569_07245 [Bacteroidota bacterium]|nr:hypothetical protein [Bacteroidota bacterium]
MGGAVLTVWHKSMDSAKWGRFPVEKQILMIGSEFARAKNLLRDNVGAEVIQCYERAFELLDLCVMDPRWRPRLKELLRFREMLGELYMHVSKDDPMFMMMYRTLMNWSGSTSRVEL